ncbi:MAG: hypothetical protein ACJ75B_07750 [Flavisolibacter sp.]
MKSKFLVLNKNRNLLSALALVLFICIAAASGVNKIHYGAFNYYKNYEEKVQGSYLVKNDGTRIYGKHVSWKSGLLTKNKIEIDDQVFKIPEIVGYYQEGKYYGRLGNSDYILRIVHGKKVNVYVEFTQVTQTSTYQGGMTSTHSYTRTDHFAQKGETGPLVSIGGQKAIKEFLSDCPLSVQMIELSGHKIRRAIKDNPNYMNEIFEVYNNDCRPVNQPNFKTAKK